MRLTDLDPNVQQNIMLNMLNLNLANYFSRGSRWREVNDQEWKDVIDTLKMGARLRNQDEIDQLYVDATDVNRYPDLYRIGIYPSRDIAIQILGILTEDVYRLTPNRTRLTGRLLQDYLVAVNRLKDFLNGIPDISTLPENPSSLRIQ